MSGSAGINSITKAIRTWNVDDAYAPNVFSDRFQNPSNVVCPYRYSVDHFYRPASGHTLPNHTVAACSDFDHRINIETELRATLPTPTGERFSYDTLNARRDEAFVTPGAGEAYFCTANEPCRKLSFSTKPERDAAYGYLKQFYDSDYRSPHPQ